MSRPPAVWLAPLALAVLASCAGSPARRAAPAATAEEPEPDVRVAEAIYVESVWPVEKQMCRADVPDAACRDVCRATGELRDVSARICGGRFEDDPARDRRCRESRGLSKRAATTCSFCSGTMTRRPCHDLF